MSVYLAYFPMEALNCPLRMLPKEGEGGGSKNVCTRALPTNGGGGKVVKAAPYITGAAAVSLVACVRACGHLREAVQEQLCVRLGRSVREHGVPICTRTDRT